MASAPTPRELMLAALRGEPVHRVVAATYNFHHLSPTFCQPTYKPLLDAWWACEEMGVLCKTPHAMSGGRRDLFSTSTHVEGAKTIQRTVVNSPKGPLQQIHVTPMGQPGYTTEHFVKDDADVERFLSLPTEPSLPDLSVTKAWHDRLGDKGLNYVSYEDPMYAVAQWFDFEDFAVKCVLEFDVISRMLEHEFQRIERELALVLEAARGYTFLFFMAGPEVATPPMLPPRLFEDTVAKYERVLVEMIRSAGQLVAIHCHGRVGMVYDMFKSIGPNALEPLEPPPQGDLTLDKALDRADGMCLMGHIQDQDLYTAQPGEMREKVRDICELMWGRASLTGYIMTSTATPYMDPPPAAFSRNYIEYMQAAQELGGF